jgi:hypothetical protein
VQRTSGQAILFLDVDGVLNFPEESPPEALEPAPLQVNVCACVSVCVSVCVFQSCCRSPHRMSADNILLLQHVYIHTHTSS